MTLVVGPILHFGGLAFELVFGPLPSQKKNELSQLKDMFSRYLDIPDKYRRKHWEWYGRKEDSYRKSYSPKEGTLP